MTKNCGRPPKVKASDLVKDVDSYIKKANPPILAEFAHLHGITRQYLYELAKKESAKGDDSLTDAIKKLSEAKEIKLEKEALKGNYAQNIAIFSLKQLGWKDRPDDESDSEMLSKARELLMDLASVIE